MRRALFVYVSLSLCACGGSQKAGTTAAKVEAPPNESAVRLFVTGAEQLEVGSPKALVRAKELLQKALALDPRLWEAHYDLGLTERKLGDLDAARASLLKARLHDLACDQLARALGAAFEPYVKADDSSVWLVRRLDVDIGLDVARSDDEVVGGWARQLGRSLSSKLDPEDPDVVRFNDRASYLARYVVERAAGTADTKWYFRMSRGLRMLPASAAIRTALTDDPADGRRALCLIESADLIRVASALSEARRSVTSRSRSGFWLGSRRRSTSFRPCMASLA